MDTSNTPQINKKAVQKVLKNIRQTVKDFFASEEQQEAIHSIDEYNCSNYIEAFTSSIFAKTQEDASKLKQFFKDDSGTFPQQYDVASFAQQLNSSITVENVYENYLSIYILNIVLEELLKIPFLNFREILLKDRQLLVKILSRLQIIDHSTLKCKIDINQTIFNYLDITTDTYSVLKISIDLETLLDANSIIFVLIAILEQNYKAYQKSLHKVPNAKDLITENGKEYHHNLRIIKDKIIRLCNTQAATSSFDMDKLENAIADMFEQMLKDSGIIKDQNNKGDALDTDNKFEIGFNEKALEEIKQILNEQSEKDIQIISEQVGGIAKDIKFVQESIEQLKESFEHKAAPSLDFARPISDESFSQESFEENDYAPDPSLYEKDTQEEETEVQIKEEEKFEQFKENLVDEVKKTIGEIVQQETNKFTAKLEEFQSFLDQMNNTAKILENSKESLEQCLNGVADIKSKQVQNTTKIDNIIAMIQAQDEKANEVISALKKEIEI